MLRCAEVTGAGRPLRVTSRPRTALSDDGVMVRVASAGVCHSDLHYIKDEIELGGDRVFHHRDFLGDAYVGSVPGHEIAGFVDALGEQAEKRSNLCVGDRVCVFPWIGCQLCEDCRAGNANVCGRNPGVKDIGLGEVSGGYGSYVNVPHWKNVSRLPEKLNFDVGCMLSCSALTAFGALRHVQRHYNGGPGALSSLLIVGAGGLGLWCAQLAGLVLSPKPKVVVSDVSEERLALAREAGADDTLNWSLQETGEQHAAATLRQCGRLDAVIDFVGSPATATVGLTCLRNSGILVCAGLHGGLLHVSLPKIISSSITIRGMKVASLEEFRKLVAMLGEVDFRTPDVEHVKLDDINEVHSRLRDGKVRGRAIIKHEH